MSTTLSGKTAIITGSASGIGAACVDALRSAGARVIGADMKVTDQSENTRSIDVADEASVEQLFSSLADTPIDIVINSAGILIDSPLESMHADDFDRLITVNLKGTFLVARQALPRMREQGGGRFIAVASELAYSGRADFSAYCASKAGVIGLVRSWAREFAPDVLVNALAPGPVNTPMLNKDSLSAEWLAKESDNPLGRIAEPEEIAAVALFLAGPGGSFMTGQTVSPNGGAVMF